MFNYIVFGILFVAIFVQLIVTTKAYILEGAKYKLEEHKYSTFLWKVECVLRDFVLAYDDEEPEKTHGAYIEADKLLQSIEEVRKKLKMPAIDAILADIKEKDNG